MLCQKDALRPFLTVTIVTALKSAKSVESIGTSVPFHGRSGFVHWNQSHRSRRAILNLSSPITPSPPNSIGLATDVQATLHFPPEISLSPAQRKHRLILSMSLSSCLGTLIEVSRYTGIALWTDRTNSLLPAGFSNLLCHPARRHLDLSMMPYTWVTLILPKVSGRPKYVIGKLTLLPTKLSRMWSRFKSVHLMGATVHLSRLSFKPVADPNRSSILKSAVTSWTGFRKITASSWQLYMNAWFLAYMNAILICELLEKQCQNIGSNHRIMRNSNLLSQHSFAPAHLCNTYGIPNNG